MHVRHGKELLFELLVVVGVGWVGNRGTLVTQAREQGLLLSLYDAYALYYDDFFRPLLVEREHADEFFEFRVFPSEDGQPPNCWFPYCRPATVATIHGLDGDLKSTRGIWLRLMPFFTADKPLLFVL